MVVFALVITLARAIIAQHIVGYTCDVSKNSNNKYTEIDVTDVEQCEETDSNYNPQPTNYTIQVIRQLDFINVPTSHCQVHLSLEAAPCGTDGIRSRIWNSEIIQKENYVMDKEECILAQKHNTLSINNMRSQFGNKAADIIIIPFDPTKNYGSTYIIGETDVTIGWCVGKQFTVRKQEFKNHLLKLNYYIHVENVTAKYYHKSRTIILPTTSTTNIKTVHMGQQVTQDSEHGTYVYDIPAIKEQYEQINYGIGQIHDKTDNSSSILIYTQSDNKQMAILLTNKRTICIEEVCKPAYSTLLNDVYIIAYHNPNDIIKLSDAAINDIGIYIELRAQFMSAFILMNINYHDDLQKISNMFCKLNNRINTLHPKRAAVDFIQQQLAESEAPINVMTGGSVLWLTTCNRVNLTLSTEETSCYNDVPVILPDTKQKLFIDPITYITKTISSETSCSLIFPMKYKLQNLDLTKTWYCFTPTILDHNQCIPPSKRNNIAGLTSRKLDFAILDTSLYPESELDKINTKIIEDSVFPDDGVKYQNTIRTTTVDRGFSYQWVDGHFRKHIPTKEQIMYGLIPGFVSAISGIREHAPDVLVIIYILRFLYCLRNCNTVVMQSPLIAFCTLLKILLMLPIDNNMSTHEMHEMKSLINLSKNHEEQLQKLLTKLDQNP